MKFLAQKSVLAPALSAAKLVVPAKPAITIAGCFLLRLNGNNLEVTASDVTGLGLRINIQVEGQENGDIAVAVEVKSKPKQGDVDDFLRKMEILRKVADSRGDRRKFQGAIAGAIIEDSVRSSALKNRLYVIEQTGDTMRIVMPEGFVPREW